MGEQTAERRAQDNDKAAAGLAKEQNASQVFAANVATRHPDTGEVVYFQEGETAPGWAVTVLGASNFKGAETSAPEMKLGPVPGPGQFVAAPEPTTSKTTKSSSSA